jgi:hemerythrin-like domain-containing protein
MSSPAPGVDTREMIAVHSAFRREFRLAPGLVRAVAPGDVSRAEVVAEHLELIATFLHHHHDGEDRLLWPKLLERVPAELAPTVALMERQHEGVHEVIEEMTAALARWRDAAAEADRDELADALDRLHALLVEHLGAEEQHILPLASSSLTAAEWGELGEDGMAAQAKSKLPMIFGMIMKDADPEVIRGMLANAPLVPRLMLPFVGPRAYARYARRIHGAAAA